MGMSVPERLGTRDGGFVPQAADLSKAPAGQAPCYPPSLCHAAPLCSCFVIAVPLFLQLWEVFGALQFIFFALVVVTGLFSFSPWHLAGFPRGWARSAPCACALDGAAICPALQRPRGLVSSINPAQFGLSSRRSAAQPSAAGVHRRTLGLVLGRAVDAISPTIGAMCSWFTRP